MKHHNRIITTARRGNEQSLLFRRRWFADDDTTQPEPDNATGQNNSGSQPTVPDGYFSQDEVNGIMTKTRKEASQRTMDKLLGELGVDSPDSLKAMISDYQKRKEAEMSEAEKAQARADELQKQLEQERAAREELTVKAETERRHRIISDKLKESGAVHPDDLLVIAPKLGVSFDDVFSDDGNAIEKELDNLVAKLKQERPNAFKSLAPGSPSNRDGRPISPSQVTFENERKKIMKQRGRW